MAKGLRSASKRRYRAVKRQHVQQVVEKERLERIHGRLQQLQQGVDLTFSDITPLNAFLHPGLATSHNRRKYSPEEEEDFMKNFGHLPGKTEDPRTQKLRRKAASPPTPSSSSAGSATAAGEEHEMEENMQQCDSSRDEGMAPAEGAAAVGGRGGAKTKGTEKSVPFSLNTCSSLTQSMMLTPEMEEMMKQRRKAETGKIPVQVNKLKREAKRSSIRKKTQKPHKKKH